MFTPEFSLRFGLAGAKFTIALVFPFRRNDRRLPFGNPGRRSLSAYLLLRRRGRRSFLTSHPVGLLFLGHPAIGTSCLFITFLFGTLNLCDQFQRIIHNPDKTIDLKELLHADELFGHHTPKRRQFQNTSILFDKLVPQKFRQRILTTTHHALTDLHNICFTSAAHDRVRRKLFRGLLNIVDRSNLFHVAFEKADGNLFLSQFRLA